jgi:hypothetical protein
MSEKLGTFFNLSKLKTRMEGKSVSQNDMSQFEISWATPSNVPCFSTNLIPADGNEPVLWAGWLLKRSRGPLGAWQPRSFELRNNHTADCASYDQKRRSALLIYRSDSKGERQLLVDDVQREHHLDSGLRIAFSVCIAQDDAKHAGKGGGGRMLLMASTDLEAVAFLSCLRRILEPGRAWPTLLDGMHYPGIALRDLEGRRSV